ncbi:Predicted transcriptional regulator [Rhodococcus ruber]|uniref:Predicted transcriptional regulator n=1 Tax=Rhodococcus ruber TaxID=1830 RepID=A0A098BUY9_9NOCA|nr:Predicted transcriptional regulator [Rhodococcus ruber]
MRGDPLTAAARSGADQPLGQVTLDLVEPDALLRHGVALADGDGLVLEGVEVDRDAERGADLVLAAVAAADGAGVVELDVPVLAQLRGEVLRLGAQIRIARQRQHRRLDRGEPAIEAQHGALVDATLRVGCLVLAVGVDEERHERTRQTRCRLDDVRGVPLVGGLVEEAQVGTRVLRVRRQVEVGAVGDALELAPFAALEVEAVLDVDGALGVVGQLVLRVLVQAQVVLVDAESGVPVHPVVDPVLVPLLVLARLDEELHLHLLELAGPEDAVARGDLVAEALAGLADAERRLLARRGEHVGEVHEDALRGLGTQVVQPLLALDRAEIGLEHHVEVAGLGPLALGAAVGAGDLRHRNSVGIVELVLLGVRLLQVILAVALVTAQALDERIVEDPDMTRGHPHLTRQDHRRVQSDDVLAAGDHVAPPLLLDVLLELHAERPVVPGRPRTAVDLTAGIDQAPALGQVGDGIDLGFRCHSDSLHLRCGVSQRASTRKPIAPVGGAERRAG